MTRNADEITKQALEFQKDAFDSWYDAMSIFQDQASLAVDKLINQTSWIPDEGRQVLSGWAGTCKKERERYKAYMEESFSVLENQISQNTKDAPARPDKPAEEEKPPAPAMNSKAAVVEGKKATDVQETKQSNP